MDDEPLYLNDTWSCYFHSPLNNDWRNESYTKVTEICSAEDFWCFHEAIDDNLSKGMFFIMREHVFPCWDDASNINGGCLSIKVPKTELLGMWEQIIAKMLSESFLKDKFKDKWHHINGVSTSPKRNFCIIKIWVGSTELQDINDFDLPFPYNGEVIYKTNMSNISMDNLKLSNSHYREQQIATGVVPDTRLRIHA